MERAQSPLKLHVVLNSVAVETEKFCSDSGDMLTKSGINIISYLKWIWYAKLFIAGFPDWFGGIWGRESN